MRKFVPLRGFQLFLIILISALVGYFFGTRDVKIAWKNYKPIASINSKTPLVSQSLDMGLFYQVIDKLNQDYYDKSKIDTKKILEGAINGALASLDDPYTSFFPPKQNTEFKTQLAGEFSGIGAELSASDNKIVVVAPLDGSPAARAGIKPADVILKVNGESTAGWTVSQAVDKIRGPKGSTVLLSVIHDKAKTPFDAKIIRDTIVIKSVTSWVKNILCSNDVCSEDSSGKTVAYIRLSQFGDKTNDEWTAAVNAINEKIRGKKIAGIVLDLRNNPGGYLSDAVFIASEFVKSGVIVQQENAAKVREGMSVSRMGTLLDQPLVVLINKGSASASEIVSGALRDHKRAKLVGEQSFGKGTVQQAIDVDGGGSLHVSIARWLTPAGTWVNKVGLTPDVKVDYDASKSAKVVKYGLDNQIDAGIEELLK